jgi:hypothetical protein|tara:strand:+ start:275 stop:499 length:225 start_codon:yes stop_codon:yes gene_type:complete
LRKIAGFLEIGTLDVYFVDVVKMVIGGEDLGFFRNSAGGNNEIGEGKNSSFSVKLPRLIPCRDRGGSVAHEAGK